MVGNLHGWSIVNNQRRLESILGQIHQEKERLRFIYEGSHIADYVTYEDYIIDPLWGRTVHFLYKRADNIVREIRRMSS